MLLVVSWECGVLQAEGVFGKVNDFHGLLAGCFWRGDKCDVPFRWQAEFEVRKLRLDVGSNASAGERHGCRADGKVRIHGAYYAHKYH